MKRDGQPSAVHIVTNFREFPAEWSTPDGTSGTAEHAADAEAFLRLAACPGCVFVVNCAPNIVLRLARARAFGTKIPPLIAVDLVLRQPRTIRDRISAFVKRMLLRHVDLFIHYFRDTKLLNDAYGIGGDRGVFVDFKANVWPYRVDGPRPEGAYALCFGRSLRDYDTFFDAIEIAGVPGAIVDPRVSRVAEHGSRLSRNLDQFPTGLLILPDDMSNDSQVRLLKNARIVVVPVVKGSLVASGISTILNAMVLGKMVIATSGPGVTDLFTSEVVQVPAEDPAALAAALRSAWTDEMLRERIARQGWSYGMRCGDANDLMLRVAERVAAHVRAQPH